LADFLEESGVPGNGGRIGIPEVDVASEPKLKIEE